MISPALIQAVADAMGEPTKLKATARALAADKIGLSENQRMVAETLDMYVHTAKTIQAGLVRRALKLLEKTEIHDGPADSWTLEALDSCGVLMTDEMRRTQ